MPRGSGWCGLYSRLCGESGGRSPCSRYVHRFDRTVGVGVGELSGLAAGKLSRVFRPVLFFMRMQSVLESSASPGSSPAALVMKRRGRSGFGIRGRPNVSC